MDEQIQKLNELHVVNICSKVFDVLKIARSNKKFFDKIALLEKYYIKDIQKLYKNYADTTLKQYKKWKSNENYSNDVIELTYTRIFNDPDAILTIVVNDWTQNLSLECAELLKKLGHFSRDKRDKFFHDNNIVTIEGAEKMKADLIKQFQQKPRKSSNASLNMKSIEDLLKGNYF